MSYELSSFKDLMAKCSHCAFCQATCPVFKADLLETHMPRARMKLAKGALVDGDVKKTRRLKKIMNRCLLCGNCAETCPANVPVNDIIIAARKELFGGKRKKYFERSVLNSYMANRGLNALQRFAYSAALKSGLIPEGLPGPSGDNFSKQYTGVFPPKGETRARVAYFVGCATNSSYVDTGRSVLNVFARNGIEVIVPEGLVCCGIPALAEGDTDTAYNMALSNVRILSELDVDAIITDCTTCGYMLKENAVKLAPADTPLMEKAVGVAAKVWEATDYLDSIGLTEPPPKLKATLTYHTPCHRHWSPTLADAPRNLTAQIPDADLKELEDPEACCGAGGSFFVQHQDLSNGIRCDKISQIEHTGARTVITQCPACRSYINAGAPEKHVMHPMDFLAQAYGPLNMLSNSIKNGKGE